MRTTTRSTEPDRNARGGGRRAGGDCGLHISEDGCVDLSIDFAHAIHTGVGKELYYLEIVTHCVEFAWVIPTRDHERPEVHLQQFLDLTGLLVHTIWHDDAAKFARSATFRAWADSINAMLCPVAGYKHTLNSKAAKCRVAGVIALDQQTP
eukprot:3333903-Rhodomonas_salina.1